MRTGGAVSHHGSSLASRTAESPAFGPWTPPLLTMKPVKGLRRLGHLGVPGILDGEHVHVIELLRPARTRCVPSARYRGVLVPFAGGMPRDMRHGFEEMNRALKAFAEAA